MWRLLREYGLCCVSHIPLFGSSKLHYVSRCWLEWSLQSVHSPRIRFASLYSFVWWSFPVTSFSTESNAKAKPYVIPKFPMFLAARSKSKAQPFMSVKQTITLPRSPLLNSWPHLHVFDTLSKSSDSQDLPGFRHLNSSRNHWSDLSTDWSASVFVLLLSFLSFQ